ncbi:E1 ubiquitin-activating protein uba2 [Coemansia sp. RSA 1933]|nr:E1 ubiquitin-activating protein uba2 [Coemansia sp. RSA 1933]
MRDTKQLAKLFGEQTASALSNARVLVVGAGGIGCELLKGLSMSGFAHIHAVDLDTIDLSNLNRQFLFQRMHIKKPKAQVATQAIGRFNPGIDASFAQANIKQPEFDVDWFKRFDLVFNALDNLDARRHVNAMCLAAHVPLVESGTAGYLGQVTVIHGGTTECFECQPKPAERKTYPVCTIRSTPTAPIHCIVWAKDYLFAQLFGEPIPDELNSDEEDLEELQQLREESRALAKLTDAMGTSDFARLVFQKVFNADVARLLSMHDMWKHRQPPCVLDLDGIATHEEDPSDIDDQAEMSLEQSTALFIESAARLAQRRVAMAEDAFMSFDKDDDDALRFVAAAANLRSYAFGIPAKSVFTIKAMAGNIIPAIATTNAIVAGLMVVQGTLVLSGRISQCHTAYLSYGSKRPRTIVRDTLALPNPRCAVCRRRFLTLRVADCTQTTLKDVVDHIAALSGSERDLQLGDELSVVEGSRILYDYDFDDNLLKSLKDLGIVPGKMITLTRDDDDDDDDAVVPVVLSIARMLEDAGDSSATALVIEGFELVPEFAPLPPHETTSQEASDAADVVEAGLSVADNGIITIDDDTVTDVQSSSDDLAKRKTEDMDNAVPPGAKRRATGDSEFLEILD